MKSIGRRDFALIDALALVSCLVAGIAVMGGVMGQAEMPDGVHPKSIDDAGRIRQIHRSMLVFASDNKDRFPLPGLINRLPDLPSPPGVGNAPGIGPEDDSLNTTANLYAAMIAQNYYESKLVISPVERNPRVQIDVDYDYNQYKPAADT